MSNNWIITFTKIIYQKTGLPVSPDHVHISERRQYYIPQAEPGHPLFLHHYRGPYFIDIHPDDYEKLSSGKVSTEEYINNAYWAFGYYWGGGNMISGGYFTPLENTPGLNNREKIYRFMTIIACEGNNRASGYTPTFERCSKCSIEKCPFSIHKGNYGNYSHEIPRPDGRKDFVKIVAKRLRSNYGYKLEYVIFCLDVIPENDFMLLPNYTERSFILYISDQLVKKLLYHVHSTQELEQVVGNMNMYVGTSYVHDKKRLITSKEDFNTALEEFDIIKEWEKWEKRSSKI